MSNAWAQGAPTVTFKGITHTDFQAEIAAAAAVDQGIAEMETQLKMKKTDRDERYSLLNEKSVKIRDGVEGREDFGLEHPLYEAMGFVRPSDRKSGLTRKKDQRSSTKG
jgi:type VI protein secretion system component VasK